MLRGLPLPQGIAPCRMLAENVFFYVLALELRIPLFCVGRPGTSKSIAKKILSDHMKGERSSGPFFRLLRSVTLFSYQCSPHTTSEEIAAVLPDAYNPRDIEEGETDGQAFFSCEGHCHRGSGTSSPLPLKIEHYKKSNT